MAVAALAHGIVVLLEVRVRGDDDASDRRHIDLVGAGGLRAAAEVDADPRTRIDGRLGVLFARLDGVGAAAERHDAEHAGTLAREHLVRGGSIDGVRRGAAGAVEDIDGHLDSVWPVSRGHVARREVRAREGHDGLDGAFGDTVQLVDVGRAGRLRHELVVK